MLFTAGVGVVAVGLPAGAAAQNPAGNIDSADCEGITGWAQDGDIPDAPIDVQLSWLAPQGDIAAVPSITTADLYQEELCLVLGSCEHGFSVPVPMSLRDELPHPVWAYGVNDGDGGNPVLGNSPAEFTCPPPMVGEGVRRPLEGAAMTDWQFSAFFNQAMVLDATIAGLPEVDPINGPPLLVRAGNGDPTVWLIDRGLKRSISAAAAKNWKFDLLSAVVWNEAQVEVIPQGTALPDEPLLLKGSLETVYLFDDLQCIGPDMDLAGCEMGGMEGGMEGGTGDETGMETGEEGETGAGDTGEGTDSGSGETVGDPTESGEGGETAETTAAPPGGSEESGGCSCSATPTAPWRALLLLPLLGFAFRPNRPRT